MSGIDEQPGFIEGQRRKQLKLYKEIFERNEYKIAGTYVYNVTTGEVNET